jgi:hypothetical protein
MELAGHVASTGRTEMFVELRVGKPDGNRSLVRYRPQWEDNMKNLMINMMELSGLVLSDSRQKRVAASCKHCNED